MRLCVTKCVVSCISNDQSASSPGLSDPEDKGIMILQHFSGHSSPIRFDISEIPMWQPQILPQCECLYTCYSISMYILLANNTCFIHFLHTEFLVQGFQRPYCYSYVILPLKLLLFQLYINRRSMFFKNKILKTMLRPWLKIENQLPFYNLHLQKQFYFHIQPQDT